jgi:basic amino acid/polyamine antiporter, APA family
LTQERFATAVAFERAFGSHALVQLIMFAVLLSLLKIFNGNFIAATRLLYAMGRRRLLDDRLSLVDERFRTPKMAIAFAGTLTAVASLAGQAVLVPISEVGSLAAAIGWLATCLAFLRGAGKIADSVRLRVVGYCGAAVASMLILMKVVPAVPGSFGRYEYVALAVWIALGFLLWKRRRTAN